MSLSTVTTASSTATATATVAVGAPAAVASTAVASTAASDDLILPQSSSSDLSCGVSSEPSSRLLVCDAPGRYRPALAEEVLHQARRVLARKVRRGALLESPIAAREYLQLQLGSLDHEVFAVLFLDARLRVIEFVPMFRGTLTQTSVYPREVVKHALQVNASSVILAHNHPSGAVDPSRADEYLTQTLKQALALVDVRVIDHLVVSANDVCSMAERGLI